MAKQELVLVFLDTNLLMEYKPLQDLDWCKQLNAKDVLLIVSRGVTADLQKNKYSDVSRRRDRANQALRLLGKVPDAGGPIEVRSHVQIQIFGHLDADYDKY